MIAKILKLKLINLIGRIILWLTLAFACFLPASALTPSAPENCVWEIFTIGYDAPVAEATDLENRTETSTSNYDTAPIHRVATEEIPTDANRSLFGQNAEFKAAEETPLALPPMSVGTPYGAAIQANSAEAIAARGLVDNGATLYRIGTMGKSAAGEAQFWSFENPLSPGYAGRYGLPPENVINADFIESATLKPGTPFVTRPARPVGTNPGGGIEVVVPPSGVQLTSFNTLGSG